VRIDPRLLARNGPYRDREVHETRPPARTAVGVGGLLGGLDVDVERSVGQSLDAETIDQHNPALESRRSRTVRICGLARANPNCEHVDALCYQ
jgi:hypothetical protein